MKVYDGSNNGHGYFKCDNCGKKLDIWSVRQLIDRTYKPGKNHDKVSSDINTKQVKILDLCPECMEEIYEIYGKGDKK